MENTQHTEGPWRTQATAGHELHGNYAVYDEATGRDIAIVYDGKSHASLIAAAPMLLEALKAMLITQKEYMPGGDRESNDLISRAEAIIATVETVTSEFNDR